MIAEKWDISRDDMEAFAVESHERALRAPAEGRFEREIAPLGGLDRRRGPAGAELGQDPVAADAGRGRAAHRRGLVARSPTRRRRCSIVSEQAVQDHGLTPRARIHHLSVRGDDPILMLTAPIPATALRAREDRA